MGLMDRLREGAQDIASDTRERLEEVAVRRRMDDAARRLGYLVFRERTKGTPAGSDADALVEQMRELDERLAAQERGPGAPEDQSDPPGEPGGGS